MKVISIFLAFAASVVFAAPAVPQPNTFEEIEARMEVAKAPSKGPLGAFELSKVMGNEPISDSDTPEVKARARKVDIQKLLDKHCSSKSDWEFCVALKGEIKNLNKNS